MWKLCVVDDESSRTVVKLVRDEYSLGRAEESTVRLTERNISRRHARLFRDESQQWWLEDQGSYTGSFVNGDRVEGRARLAHGDTVQLGDYRLELSDEEREAADVAGEDAPSPEDLPDRFVLVQGPNVGSVYPLVDQKLLIGRGEECQIALDDASVSRVHVEILRTEHGLMILDQGSSNGLRINGVDLPSAMLRSGDVVELGDVRLRFIPAGKEDKVLPAVQPAAVSGVELSHTGSSAGGGRGRAAIYGAGVLAAVALMFALAMGGGEDEQPRVTSVRVDPSEPSAASAPAPEVPSNPLTEALALSEAGSILAAHRKLHELPVDSPLRQAPEYSSIVQKWAHEVIGAAKTSPDPQERRGLLERVVAEPGVSEENRAVAQHELDRLTGEEDLKVVDVSELPKVEAKKKPTSRAAHRTRKSRGRSPNRVTVSAQLPPREGPSGSNSASGKSRSTSQSGSSTSSKKSGSNGPSSAPAPVASNSRTDGSSSGASSPSEAPKKAAPPKPKPRSESSPPELVRETPF